MTVHRVDDDCRPQTLGSQSGRHFRYRRVGWREEIVYLETETVSALSPGLIECIVDSCMRIREKV